MSEQTQQIGWFGRMLGRKAEEPLARQRLQTGSPRQIISVKEADSAGVEPEVSKAPGLQQWQELVLAYADKIPIVSAGARYYEDSAKRVKYYLADEETGEPVENPSPADLVITTINEQKEEIARAVGLRFLIGESRHTFDQTAMKIDTRGAGELYSHGDGYKVKDRGGKVRDLDSHYHVWRSYDPDRKWSDLATSSHKSMLDIMEAFVIAYAEERAVSIRLAMNTGLVGINEQVFNIGNHSDADAVNSEGSDPGAQLEARFQQMLAMTIRNPRDAASFVPPVLVTPAGMSVSDAIQHVSFAADRDKRKIQERLDMLKKEYAVGVDLPSDQAAGFLADMNHWNGKIVNETAWTDFLAPKIQSTAHDAFEEIAFALGIDVSGFTVGLDNTDLISPTDMSDTALRAHDQGIISSSSARKHIGFTEEDAPGASQDTGSNESAGTDSGVIEETDQGEGVAAAAKDGPNLKLLNRELRKARMRFERELRDVVMEAAKEFVEETPAVVTAAADPKSPDPVERVAANIFKVIRRGYQGMALAAARGLATKRANEWYERHADRIEFNATRASESGSRLIRDWLLNRSATSVPGRDAYGLARSIESEAAGGQAAIHADGTPTQARPLAIIEDDDFLRLMEDGGVGRPVYAWEHGSPPQPFAPHADLDGTTWTSDEELTVLDNPDDFPNSAIYHPGDHDGCTCRYDIEFEEV